MTSHGKSLLLADLLIAKIPYISDEYRISDFCGICDLGQDDGIADEMQASLDLFSTLDLSCPLPQTATAYNLNSECESSQRKKKEKGNRGKGGNGGGIVVVLGLFVLFGGLLFFASRSRSSKETEGPVVTSAVDDNEPETEMEDAVIT